MCSGLDHFVAVAPPNDAKRMMLLKLSAEDVNVDYSWIFLWFGPKIPLSVKNVNLSYIIFVPFTYFHISLGRLFSTVFKIYIILAQLA